MRTSEGQRQLPQEIVRFRGRYRVRMNHAGKTHPLGVYDTLTDAKAALSIARADAARGIFIPPAARRAVHQAEAERQAAASMTLGQWSENWLAALEANPESSAGTILAYRSRLKASESDAAEGFAKFFGVTALPTTSGTTAGSSLVANLADGAAYFEAYLYTVKADAAVKTSLTTLASSVLGATAPG